MNQVIKVVNLDLSNTGTIKQINLNDKTKAEKKSNWFNIIDETEVNYLIDYISNRSFVFDLLKYKLTSPNITTDLFESLFAKYYNLHSNRWYNTSSPDIEKSKLNNNKYVSHPKKDPVFGEKVNIKNPNSKIYLIGDIHSSLHSLIQILKKIDEDKGFIGDSLVLNKDFYIFFLGDLVDRGPYSVEVLTLALILKNLNFNNVFIINGNHEDYETYNLYGLTEEYEKQVESIETIKKLLFYLPSVIFLNFTGTTYHLSHGSFDYNHLSNPYELNFFLKDDNFKFILIDKHNPNNDLKWGDFRYNNGSAKTTKRGNIYGPNLTEEYLDKFNIKCILSGHQDLSNLLIQTSEMRHNSFDININHNINGTEYTKDKKNFGSLLTPLNYTDEIYLRPKTDFIALTTSTATIAKKLGKTTYLEIIVDQLQALIISCNQ